MTFHLIRTIARYEMRTLLRSWFFRIFVGLSIVGLGIFNVAMNLQSSGAPWIYRALGASIPYANLIILNLGQAIVAVFLASEFLKQDRKNDTVEVIYARSMSNGQYIIGKTLGILSVFFVLNLLVLLMGIGFSFLSTASSQNVVFYLAYPLLISLPTLVFILGLSFFMMVLVKNQAVTFIILLGYIALSIFYLNQKAFHLFDYIAYQVPMMYSSISGFGNFTEIIIHRCIYLFLGIGLIAMTIYLLQRLPQNPKLAIVPLYIGIFFFLLGGLTVYKYLDIKQTASAFRQSALAINNQFATSPRATVTAYSINLEHRENQIAVEANLEIENQTTQSLDTLFFSLNPGLLLNKISVNGQSLSFKRNIQLIIVPLTSPLQPHDKLHLSFQYEGVIDENICFLDKDPKTYEDNFNLEVFTLRKSYAFLQKNYVCLTSESLWYPISGVGYSSTKPMFFNSDFALYTLKVKTTPNLTAISQGKISQPQKGVFEFKPEYPLSKISLVIGNYKKYSLKVDSLEYNLFTIKGDEYFEPGFKNIADTLPFLIRELKKEYELNLGLPYPFKRLTLAEVPVHFALDNHEYSYTSDAMQPEMILYPEKGVLFDDSDFKTRKVRIEKEMKRNNQEALSVEIESRMLKDLVRNNFIAKQGHYYDFETVNWTTYSLFPLYYSFITQLKSDTWPILNTAFEAYVMERNNNFSSNSQWYEGLSKDEKINLELNRSSLKELLSAGIPPIKDERNPLLLRDIMISKGKHLFNVLRAKYGEAGLDSLLYGLIKNHTHKPLYYEELSSVFESKYKFDLAPYIQNWYTQKTSPGFLIDNISSYKVVAGEATKFQIRFTVSNPEKSDGIVTLSIELNNPNRDQRNEEWWERDDFKDDFSRKIFLPAQSSREVGYIFDTEPTRMSLVTHISKNLPTNLKYDFTGFSETRNVAVLDTIKEVPFISDAKKDNEIIVDNEDPGFSVNQTGDRAYLKSIIKKGDQPRYPYSPIRSWNPPAEWKAVLHSSLNGSYIHSAYYTRGGNGERTISWKARLPEKTTYDVYFYLDKANFGWQRNNKSPEYNLTVFHDGGAEKIKRSSDNEENGWISLGTFTFTSDSAKVELSNLTNGNMIFADAVKWVISK